MARPKSDDKRNAILAAATRVFAERGLAASPTSAISKAAGVAEGTLFTYFGTKDVLMNELYREIKTEIADAVLPGAPGGAARVQIAHVWERFVDWGVANPDKCKVIAQLGLTSCLSEDTRAAGIRPFLALETLMRASIADGTLRDYPVAYIAATMNALADTTMQFMRAEPQHAARYRRQGFELFWSGITAEGGR
jgi:AcrR family transcriptional regulator